MQRRLLASDMDGTLLPTNDSIEQLAALAELNAHLAEPEAPLFVIATGRRFDSVMEAYREYTLPTADWIICDVGSAIYKKVNGRWENNRHYAGHLQQLLQDWNHDRIFSFVETLADIWPQDELHQQEFKASFNMPGDKVQSVAAELTRRLEEHQAPLNVIFCHDLESGEGMVDVLPKTVSKAYALQWLAQDIKLSIDHILFAGDSGNDLAAFLSGLRSIVVANAEDWIHEQAHAKAKVDNTPERIYSAKKEAITGLVEGLRHFGWLSD